MRRTPYGLIPLLAAVIGCSHGERLVERPADGGRSLVIRDVRIFDAPRAVVRDDIQDVVIRDGRIVAIGIDVDADGLPEVKGNGATLIPGLVDLHTHTGSSSEPPGSGFALPDVDANLAAYLYAGVTTVLDLGSLSPDVFRLRDAIASGKTLGPHLYAAGPIFTAPGGHPVEVLRPTLPWFLRWYVIPRVTREIASADAGIAAVNALLPEHPDFLKVVLDAGTGEVPRLAPATFAAITAAGHAGRVRSITHVTRAEDALVAVQNGTDALAHLPPLDEISDQVAATIAAARVPVVATLAIWDLIDVDHQRKADEYLPIEHEVAGPELMARLRAPRKESSPFEHAVAAGHDARRRSFKALQRAGVTILAGSDACNPTDLPGAALHLELMRMAQAGMTPGQALKAATVDNATFLAGPDADFGTIAVGKRADLVLIAGNPTLRLMDLGRIAAVVLDGALLKRRPR